MTRSRLAAFTLACLLIAPQVATSEEEGKPMRPSITVSGVGKISAAPDVAEINVGVVTQAPTAGEALSNNTASMTKLFALLKERGVAAKDIQTTQISVSPQYSQPPRPIPGQEQQEFIPRIVGYRVDNSVQITARKLEKLGETLDALVQSGANQINGISFRVDAPESLLEEARKKAMQDAKRKAELLAGEAGVVVGAPRTIILNEGGGRPPMAKFAAAEMRMMSAPVPVAGGEEELSVSVSVVYELVAPK